MASPKSTTELRRFMGMVNQLGKISSQIALTFKTNERTVQQQKSLELGTTSIRSNCHGES